jgi:dipeptidyl aminopeptidase/acylaminoacyl peptidase
MPPILLIHGDADKLVPPQQSELFKAKCEELKVPVTLLIRPGKAHGWAHIDLDMEDVAKWFDGTLK